MVQSKPHDPQTCRLAVFPSANHWLLFDIKYKYLKHLFITCNKIQTLSLHLYTHSLLYTTTNMVFFQTVLSVEIGIINISWTTSGVHEYNKTQHIHTQNAGGITLKKEVTKHKHASRYSLRAAFEDAWHDDPLQ